MNKEGHSFTENVKNSGYGLKMAATRNQGGIKHCREGTKSEPGPRMPPPAHCL